jgi:hypothetical protein
MVYVRIHLQKTSSKPVWILAPKSKYKPCVLENLQHILCIQFMENIVEWLLFDINLDRIKELVLIVFSLYTKPFFIDPVITMTEPFGGSGFMEKRWNDMNSNLNNNPSAGALKFFIFPF